MSPGPRFVRRQYLRIRPAWWLAGGMLFGGGVARAAHDEGPNPYLEQAKQLYAAVKYELCVQRLEQGAAWKSSPPERLEVELYAGLCHFNLGHADEAAAHFELALKLEPKAALPRYSPPRAVALFEKVSKRLAAAPPAARSAPSGGDAALAQDAPRRAELAPKADGPAPAQVETVTPDGPTKGAGRSWILPASLAGASLAATGGGTAVWFRAQALARLANDEPFEARAFQLQDEARRTAVWSYVLFGVGIAAAAGAITTYVLAEP